MKLLIIILLLPLTVFAHRYRVSSDPNNSPFLPIFPVYPYNPKLIKRGVDKDHSSGHINSELYAPKPDAKDSYASNYHKDSHSSTPSQNIYQASYMSPNQVYTPATSAYSPGSSISSQYYNVNPYLYTIYNGYPVALVASSPTVNSRLPNNYYYQQQYNPNYSTYSSAAEGSQFSQENDGQIYGKYSDIPKSELNTKDGQFSDGSNYLTNSKELETSASTYRVPGHLNKDNEISDLHLRSAQLPKTMLRIVPYDNQQFRPISYDAAYNYNRYQQLANQGAINMFGQLQTQYDISQINQNRPVSSNIQTVSAPVIAKTGLAYVMNPSSFNIVSRHIPKVPDTYQNFDSSVIPDKSQKPVTTVTVEGSQGLYIPPLKLYKQQSQTPDYSNYSSQNGPIYESSPSSMMIDYKKNENYSPEDVQTVQPGQSYSYQYSGYQPTSNNPSDNYKTTLDDVNFASKRKS